MSLDQHVSVTLVVNNSGLTAQAFGTIGHLSYTTLWTDPSRTYSRKSEAIADGFASDGPEVAFLNRVFSAQPRPPSAKILRGTRPPTQSFTINATTLANKTYTLSVGGQGVTAGDKSFTTGATPNRGQVHQGLVVGLNAVVGRNFLAAFAAPAFADFTFTVPDPSNDLLHAVAHGRQTGDGPVRAVNAGGGLPVGIPAVTDLFLVRVDADNLKVADSLAHALAGVTLDVTTTGTGVQTLQRQAGFLSPWSPFTVTATSAGAWFFLSTVNTGILSITQDHVDPGITADLDDVQLADGDWYYLDTTFNSELMTKAAAAWTEGTPFKMYVFDVCDSACENTTVGSGDVLDDIKAFEYKRTVASYKRTPGQMFSAGWKAVVSAIPVGQWTAAYKPVPGATADAFTSTQTNNLDAKRASYYKSEAQRSFAWEGKVGSTSNGFWDVTVSLDFILDRIQKRAFGLFLSVPALHITDEDIKMMEGTIQGVLDELKDSNSANPIVAPGTPGDSNDPIPVCTFPRVKDIDPSVRAIRKLPNGQAFFRLQSAFHTVDVELTVTF